MESCRWFIQGINGRQVTVEIKDYITENRYDEFRLGVGSNPNDEGSRRMTLSGPGPFPTRTMTLQANNIWTTFITDNEKTERGFSIEITDSAYVG